MFPFLRDVMVLPVLAVLGAEAGLQEPLPPRHVPRSPLGDDLPDGPSRDSRLEQLVTLEDHVPFVPPESPGAWFDRRDELRRQILVAAGLWPEPPRCALDPVLHGAVARQGYTVEKVFFRALPGLYVTASLYRPTALGDRLRPGVLCPASHPPGGRLTNVAEQARCAHLARMGAVVLHYDLIGHGDFRQLPHDSGFGDLQAELWSMSTFGLQTLCSIRAMDLLESLPDVDRERLGILDLGGGGTQALILGAIDDRPVVVFAGKVSPGSDCVCEQASHLRVGTGNVELAALVAPGALGLVGTEDRPGLERLYTMLGVPGKVTCMAREVPRDASAFLARHLGLRDQEEAPLVPIDPAGLTVFDEAHPRPADAKDLAGVRAWLLEHARSERKRFEELAKRDLEEFRRVVSGALAVLTHARATSGVEVVEEDAESTIPTLVVSRPGRRERVFLDRIPPSLGRHVDMLVVWPIDEGSLDHRLSLVLGRFPWLVAASVADALSSGLEIDKPMVLVYSLQTGAKGSAYRLPADERHDRHPAYTWGHNPTILAHRTQDLLTARLHVAETAGVEQITMVGLDGAAPLAICAVALAPEAFDRVVVHGGWDFDQVRDLDDPQMLPGALRWGGLPAFAALIAPTPMLWLGDDYPPAIVHSAYFAAWMDTWPRPNPPPLYTLTDAIEAWLAR